MRSAVAALATALGLSFALAADAAVCVHPGPIKAVRAPALNHIYVVVDAATFAALRDSAKLADLLGRSDGGLPDYAPPAPDADRIFFRGRETYLEVFAPDNRFGEPVGKVGLAIGHDDPGDFDALETAWGAACGDRKRRSPVVFTRIEPPVAWYDAVQCDDTAAGPDLALWAMVYRPEFHRWQTGQHLPGPPRTARAEILAPRRGDGQGLFDIKGLAVDVDPVLLARLVEQLQRAGFVQEDKADGALLTGDGFVLMLREKSGAETRIALDLEVATASAGSLRLGGGSLETSNGGAVLTFGSRTLANTASIRPTTRNIQ